MNRGDIYLMLVPFTDGSGVKTRPAVIVSTDDSHRRFDDVTVIPITSNTTRSAIVPTQVLIDLTTTDGLTTGLLHSSVARCEKVATLHRSLLGRKIGHLSPTFLLQLDATLKIALGLM